MQTERLLELDAVTKTNVDKKMPFQDGERAFLF